MKCPHCHIDINTARLRARCGSASDEASQKTDYRSHIDFTGLFVINFFIFAIPYAVIVTWLNNNMSWNWSVEHGAAANWYLIPIIVWAVYIAVYCFLYEHNKVKGYFLYKGA